MQFHAFDKDYLEKLKSGEFRTQEHFVSYFSELIRLKLSKRMHSAAEVEDARQETFARVLTALRKEDGIREPERLGAFVNSVCNNVLLEHYRSSSQESANGDEESEANIPDPAVSVIDVIVEREMQHKVRHVLEGLQEKDRRLIKGVFLDERDKDEVCRELGVDRQYLRVLLHRAKKSFKSEYLKKMAKQAVKR
ncbi:MAG TPA: sigma-70 family RNA polymerase sigma factor [Candidatus Aquilonibacter sp.]|nr:sigma-70 family RNA polymerase sigma factor [Candidatus Aquilonibacter sp.]